MKIRIYIISLLLCLAFVSKVSARKNYEGSRKYEKILVKRIFDFSVDKTLQIENQRGSITINNWEKPQVEVTVKLIADIKKKRKLNKLIENSEVSISSDNWEFESECDTKINLIGETFGFEYIIYAPKNLKIDLETTFGDIGIQSISSNSKIKAKFTTLQLNNTVGNDGKSLVLKLQFADDVHIGYVSNLELEAKFSTVEIDKVDRIETRTRFSKLSIEGKISEVEVDSKHDKLNMENVVDFVTSKMEFSSLKIKQLLNSLFLEDIRFGKVKIENLAEDFENIDISAQFTPIKINTGSTACKLHLQTHFGRIGVEEDVDIKYENRKDNYTDLECEKKGKGKKGRIKVVNKHAKITIK